MGANEFKSGLLKRPSYNEYLEQTDMSIDSDIQGVKSTGDVAEEKDDFREIPHMAGLTKRKTGITRSVDDKAKEVPMSMKRMRSRRSSSIRRQNITGILRTKVV